MPKTTYLTLFLLSFVQILTGQGFKSQIVTTDLDNFWLAFDQISQSTDSVERLKLINELYIDQGTEGLKGFMAVRRYTDKEFVNNIINYPQYWQSIRGNMALVAQAEAQIEQYLANLKAIYPDLKPANIYFSVGAFRSGGTYDGPKVLLGAEYLLAQPNSFLEELPAIIRNTILEYAPYDIALTAIHEYIHTQQTSWEDKTIIHLCVAEGVAEFISTLLTEKPLSPPVKFGKANPQRVMDRYMIEILRNDDIWNWLWSENENELKVKDLGYYIGYEICERYYLNATDKQQAIKDLIELDYSDDAAFAKLVDASKFLPLTVEEIGIKYESLRPTVKRIVEFKNGSQKVSPKLNVITIEFSEAMNSCCRSVDFDETPGVERLMIKKHIGWSSDKKSYSFEVEALKPNTTYGLIISNFAKEDGGNRLAPYTIRFKTKS